MSFRETLQASTGNNERAWAAVHTQPHRETVAFENLERQNFEAYCPFVRKRVRHARNFRDVLRPMFPGYLFVAIDPVNAHWRPIKSTIGVHSLVSCGNQLCLLSDTFVSELRAREISGVIARPQSPYRIGQQIQIAGGPFDGLIGTIIGMNEKERLTVLMNLLCGYVKVSVEGRSSMVV